MLTSFSNKTLNPPTKNKSQIVTWSGYFRNNEVCELRATSLSFQESAGMDMTFKSTANDHLCDFRLVPQTMPYQGSKRKIVERIVEYFPRNVKQIVEPFAGSAAVSVNSISNGYAKKTWVNDAHEPLIRLWHEIVYSPGSLAEKYSKLWHDQSGREQEFFGIIRKRFNLNHDPADFLYILARCVKAAVRYNGNGEFNNSPDNRRCGARPDIMKKRIMITSGILSGRTKLTATDYRNVLKACTRGDLVYLDPPYQGTSARNDKRYYAHIIYDEFCEQLEMLNDRQIPFILSYDGRTGRKVHGKTLPKSLGLKKVTIRVGRSTQSTLLGRADDTYESLYISPHVSRQWSIVEQ